MWEAKAKETALSEGRLAWESVEKALRAEVTEAQQLAAQSRQREEAMSEHKGKMAIELNAALQSLEAARVPTNRTGRNSKSPKP